MRFAATPPASVNPPAATTSPFGITATAVTNEPFGTYGKPLPSADHEIPFQRAMLLAPGVPLVAKLPATITSPFGATAVAATRAPGSTAKPTPSADHVAPFQMATLPAAPPPACVNSPAAAMLPPGSSRTVRTNSVTGAPMPEPRADHVEPFQLATLLAGTPPAILNPPPATKPPPASGETAPTMSSVPVPSAHHETPSQRAMLADPAPPIDVHPPPAITSPFGSVHNAWIATDPAPSDDHDAPFHRPMPGPDANVPPAIRSPFGSTVIALTTSVEPAPRA